MKPQTEYKKLVAIVKKERMKQDLPYRYEDIAGVMGYDRSYFSSLLGGRHPVTQHHIKLLKLHFPFLNQSEKKRDIYELMLSIEKKLDILIKKK
jgi:hypothetical protein